MRKTELKKDLLDQLEEKGIYGSMYLDMINDYLALWDIKNALIKDIKKKGVSIYWCNGGGQEGFKKNDSIAVFVNRKLYHISLENWSTN